MVKDKTLVVLPFIICEVMPVCVVKISHFRSVLEYAVFLSKMNKFEQNICLFLNTIRRLAMCYSWEIIWKCFLFNEGKEAISENLYFSIFRYSVQMQMYVYA